MKRNLGNAPPLLFYGGEKVPHVNILKCRTILFSVNRFVDLPKKKCRHDLQIRGCPRWTPWFKKYVRAGSIQIRASDEVVPGGVFSLESRRIFKRKNTSSRVKSRSSVHLVQVLRGSHRLIGGGLGRGRRGLRAELAHERPPGVLELRGSLARQVHVVGIGLAAHLFDRCTLGLEVLLRHFKLARSAA